MGRVGLGLTMPRGLMGATVETGHQSPLTPLYSPWLCGLCTCYSLGWLFLTFLTTL